LFGGEALDIPLIHDNNWSNHQIHIHTDDEWADFLSQVTSHANYSNLLPPLVDFSKDQVLCIVDHTRGNYSYEFRVETIDEKQDKIIITTDVFHRWWEITNDVPVQPFRLIKFEKTNKAIEVVYM